MNRILWCARDWRPRTRFGVVRCSHSQRKPRGANQSRSFHWEDPHMFRTMRVAPLLIILAAAHAAARPQDPVTVAIPVETTIRSGGCWRLERPADQRVTAEVVGAGNVDLAGLPVDRQFHGNSSAAILRLRRAPSRDRCAESLRWGRRPSACRWACRWDSPRERLRNSALSERGPAPALGEGRPALFAYCLSYTATLFTVFPAAFTPFVVTVRVLPSADTADC